MSDLTPIQRRVFESLLGRADRGEAPPSYRDLCKEYGWASTASARDHLRALARKGYIELSGGRARLTRINDMVAVARIPILGGIVAGAPMPAEQTMDGSVPVPADWVSAGTSFALRVSGESMIGAGVFPGDLVVVRRCTRAQHGEIVAVTVGSETTLKRLELRGKQVVLVADNPDYDDIEVQEEMLVHGVVVGLLRRLDGPSSTHGGLRHQFDDRTAHRRTRISRCTEEEE